MKLLNTLLGAGLCALALSSCVSDEESTWKKYADWREANENFLAEKEASGEYTRITAEWNDKLYALMRYTAPTEPNAENLTPLYTSTVKVKYEGSLMDGTVFDNSYAATDSLVTLSVNGVISGWVMALQQMHVLDEVELLVPYAAGYGSAYTTKIPPYSTLVFTIKLADIPTYEVRN